MNRILTTIFFVLAIFSYNAKSVIYNFSLEKGVKIPYEEIIVYADGISFGSLNSEGSIVLEKFYDDIYLKNENIDSIPCLYSKNKNIYSYSLYLSKKGNDLLMDDLLDGKYISSSKMEEIKKGFDEFSQLIKEGKATAISYEGDMQAMRFFIANNLRYPQEAVEENFQGKVYLLLTIDEKGKVVDVSTIYSPSVVLAKEAMRVAMMLNKFIPAKLNGVKIKQHYVIPMQFKLD
jgi:TonB family protein